MRFLTYDRLAAGDLADKVARVRAAIERDDFKSPDVKRLHVGPYYRAKLDDAARLLLMFVQWREERACLALEIIRNHAYAQSRFLRGAPVNEAKMLEDVTSTSVEAAPIRYLHASRPTFHLLDKPLSFDDAQEGVLRQTAAVGAGGLRRQRQDGADARDAPRATRARRVYHRVGVAGRAITRPVCRP